MKSRNRVLQALHYTHRLNSGQAIIIIAMAAIGLLAMMGLAIDGGRLLFLQRDTRNTADAAAIAAARALCTGRDPEPFALAAADENGFDNNRVDNWIDVYAPPISAGYAIPEECEGCYVEVSVKGEIPPTFIGIVYSGDLAATSRAIGTCNPDINANEPPELRGVWAMGEACPPNSVEISGSDIWIEGGGHSNGTMKILPDGIGGGIVIGPTSVVDPYNDSTIVLGEDKITWDPGEDDSDTGETSTGSCLGSCFEDISGGDGPSGPGPYVTEKKEEWPVDYDMADFQLPDGTEAKAAQLKGEYYEFPCSGKFYDWVKAEHMTGNAMDNGIYYMECNIKVDKLNNVTGNVTIVSTGDIDVSGDHQNWEPYVQDLLLFSTAGSGCDSVIKFSGNNNQWEGNIFAPNGGIQMSSANNFTARGCLVAQQVQLSGSSNQVICEADVDHVPQPGIWLSE
jgi:hypothetical protein